MNEEKFILLMNEILKKLPKKGIALAFSGGIDSSFLAKLMKDAGIKFKSYVVGFKGCYDFESAEKSAKKIGIKLEKIKLNDKKLEKALKEEANILRTLSRKNKEPITMISVSFNLPLFFVAKIAGERNIIVGQGPDEMLGGYSRHLALTEKEAEKEMKEDTRKLFSSGILQQKAMASYFKKKALMPYLDNKVVDFCMSLPYNEKISNKKRKLILRNAGMRVDLGKEISFKEKKAAQYGSGIMSAINRIARQKKIHMWKLIS